MFAFALDETFSSENGAAVDPLHLYLHARVTDRDGGVGEAETWLPIARQSILIQAAPESGSLKPGLDNLIHVHTRYPDGHPAACTLTVDAPGTESTIQTDPEGRASLRYQPALSSPLAAGQTTPMTIVAQDAQGQRVG
jgi:hypothetical protein